VAKANPFDKYPIRYSADPAKAAAVGSSNASAASSYSSAAENRVDTDTKSIKLHFVKRQAEAQTRGMETKAERDALALTAAKDARWAKAEQAKVDAEAATKHVTAMLAHPGLKHVVGKKWDPLYGYFGTNTVTTTDAKGVPKDQDKPSVWPGSRAADFVPLYEQVKDETFMGAREPLKGSGAITDYEGQKAQQARNRMRLSTSVAAFKSAAEDYTYWMNRRAAVTQAAALGHKAAQKELDTRDAGFEILSVVPDNKR